MYFVRIIWLFLMFTAVAQAAPVATLTLLQGEAELIRGTQRFYLREGVALNPTDIVALKGNLLQLETSDGTMVLLAPDSRMMLLPGKGNALQLYLLQGILKALSQHPLNVDTRDARITLDKGAMVLQARGKVCATFLERGALRLMLGAASPIALKPGEFYQTGGADKDRLQQRPTPEFIGALPPPFLDTPASRLTRFNKTVDAQPAPPFSYADVADWLTGPESVRKILVPAWRSKASEPAFRASLQANISKHMEWDRILNPKKYLQPVH